jgi:hypothetical protein
MHGCACTLARVPTCIYPHCTHACMSMYTWRMHEHIHAHTLMYGRACTLARVPTYIHMHHIHAYCHAHIHHSTRTYMCYGVCMHPCAHFSRMHVHAHHIHTYALHTYMQGLCTYTTWHMNMHIHVHTFMHACACTTYVLRTTTTPWYTISIHKICPNNLSDVARTIQSKI